MALDYSIQYSILCNRIDELYKVVEFKQKSSLSEEFSQDFQSYLFLLAALDGDISAQEVNIINFILGEPWTGLEIRSYINVNNIYSDEFMTSVPKSFKKIAELEKRIGNTQLTYFIVKFYYDISSISIFTGNDKQDDFSEDYRSLFIEYIRTLEEVKWNL